MLERALDTSVPCRWVTADAVYGHDRRLRCWLESRYQPFVLAIPKNERLWWQGPTYVRADRTVGSLPSPYWEKHSAGLGTKGERRYDWARVPLWRLQPNEEERDYGHYLLVRRSRDEKQERAYYAVYARKEQAELKTLAQVAGRRGEIERNEGRMWSGSLRSAAVAQWVSAHYLILAGSCGFGGVADTGEKKRRWG
ncbi:transposase [Xenorhabdus bovienii]|nr:transposase [Xenorhabdus bovienii]MDE9463473.1 transposase [Xenorhabdus bovienii]MDE9471242.1 transposase [Xenorhabdus bovienii]MDE9488130.1 transposase [Xenorhabdus bovienii]MDE9516053.1 transposase [Xenorhabdus bovienii]